MDDLPSLPVGDLALETLHLELRARAFHDDRKDLTVGRPAIPFLIGEVRRRRPLRRKRAVTLRRGAVTVAQYFLNVEAPAATDAAVGATGFLILRASGSPPGFCARALWAAKIMPATANAAISEKHAGRLSMNPLLS